MSYPGLALGTGLSRRSSTPATLFWLLRRRLGGLDERRVLIVARSRSWSRRAVMAAAAWGIEHGLSQAWPATHALRAPGARGAGGRRGPGHAGRIARALLRLREFEVAFGRVMSRLVRAADRAVCPMSDWRSARRSSPAARRCAHLIVDCYTNVYAPLLPLLIPKLGLRLATAGVLAMVFQIAASVSQLGFGRLADRWHPHRLLVAGPIVTVVALSLIGVAPTTAWLAVVLVVGGLGAAAFHPPGAMLAHRFSGDAPGPRHVALRRRRHDRLRAGAADVLHGDRALRPDGDGLADAARPGGLAIVLRGLPERGVAHAAQGRLRRAAAVREAARAALPDRRAAHGGGAVVRHLRAGVSHRPRPRASAQAGVVVAMYLLASSAGGFFGGPLADRFGPRRVIADRC